VTDSKLKASHNSKLIMRSSLEIESEVKEGTDS